MPLEKQPININFAAGLDTKTDPNQVPAGKFLALENTIFTQGGLLQKRNGFGELLPLPDRTTENLATFKGSLTALGKSLFNYSPSIPQWNYEGFLSQISLSTQSLIRNSTSQSQIDSTVASNGLVCTVFTNIAPSTAYYYTISDQSTGQNVIAPTLIVTPSESPRVFVLGSYFIILFSQGANLKYISIPFSNPSSPSTNQTLVTNYAIGLSQLNFDGVIANNNLYVAYNGSDGGGAIRMTYLNAFLVRQTTATGTNVSNTHSSSIMSMCADTSGASPRIWLAFYKTSTTTLYTMCVDLQLNVILAITDLGSAVVVLNVTCTADLNLCYIFAEIQNNYTWDSSIPSHYVERLIVDISGSEIDAAVNLRGVGLASKAFAIDSVDRTTFRSVFSSGAHSLTITSVQQNGVSAQPSQALYVGQLLIDVTTHSSFAVDTRITSINGNVIGLSAATLSNSAVSPGDQISTSPRSYYLAAYQSYYQSSYFLVDSIAQIVSGYEAASVVGKLAYENGNGYLTLGLPSVSLIENVASIGYLLKDQITPVNKNTNVPTGSQTVGIFAQIGCNLVSFDYNSKSIVPVEIGGSLQIPGSIVYAYDGAQVVEQGFHLFPDLDLHTPGDATTYQGLTSVNGSGNVEKKIYFYQATYEWQDNQGNIHRSAPSIPVKIDLSGKASDSNTNTIKIPTLRLTNKNANPVKICLYRWSTGQQVYYQVTSVSSPTLNSPIVDLVTIMDTFSDATILGNAVLYTTGGVVENIAPPSAKVLSLFKSRLFLIDSEDPNLLWYSKQVIESTPVETSDLFTEFVAPTIGAQGNTGDLECLAPMDDKLILFKKGALYYITGTGPDNTGGNNDFSDPIFISATIGSDNQASIAFTPEGLMFDAGGEIWILGRDLSTNYIGAPVEALTKDTRVLSSLTVPNTNQVRFNLASGITLVYDYYYEQWSSFTTSAVSTTVFESLSTYVNARGEVFQETPGAYLDGSRPVLIKFTTAWLKLAGLQGFQRAYFFYLLANYISPHKLTIDVAYDYNPSPTQTSIITPDNFSPVYGDETIYGGADIYGGASPVEPWTVFFERQKCEAVQITLAESFDASFGQPPGAGLTMSGLNVMIGAKSGYPRRSAARSVG